MQIISTTASSNIFFFISVNFTRPGNISVKVDCPFRFLVSAASRKEDQSY